MSKSIIYKKRRAFSLVEIVVSVLISATVAMASFMIFTSTATSQRKANKKEIASLAIKMVQEQLKLYVTSDISAWYPHKPNASWRLCNHTGQCDTYNGWALQAGSHNITSFLSVSPFVDMLCNGNISNCSFTYTVTDRDCGFGTGTTACKDVIFNLTYPDN
ncbi:MAG: type II secretion system GspH family protein [Elusimicrobiales bacterium]|nr:type II secretion system GspH family protein [Elusimicrobiales bacterium]